MPISYSIKGTPLEHMSASDRKFLGLDEDGIFKVGIEFMSYMNQVPNGPEASFVLSDEEQEGFACHLSEKGFTWPFITPVVLHGASWTREV